LLQAPVCNSYLHNDSFPAGHALWCGPLGYQGSKPAMKLIAKADVVLALGTRLGPFGTLPQYGIEYWPKDAKIIQIDADAKMLGLVKPISVGICGDAKAAAQALVARLTGKTLACIANKDARLADVAAVRKAWETELDGWAHETDAWSVEVAKSSTYMHPRQMLRELERAMPADAMVSTDIGNICSVSNSYLRFERPRSMFAAMSFGNCGYAFRRRSAGRLPRPTGRRSRTSAMAGMSREIQTCVREAIWSPPSSSTTASGARRRRTTISTTTASLGVKFNAAVVGGREGDGAEGQRIEKLGDRSCAARSGEGATHGRTTILR
jgi:sulfoacetaldehyde acetyltransferase